MQRFGGFGQIEIAPRSFLNKSKLVKVHIEFQLKMKFIMPEFTVSQHQRRRTSQVKAVSDATE